MHVDEHRAKWAIQGTSSGDPMSAKTAAEVLNEMLAMDPVSTHALLFSRVQCNAELANHPQVQVCDGNFYSVGLLGVLNGICAREDPDGELVMMSYDADLNRILRFEAVKPAAVYDPPAETSPGVDES